MRTAEKTSSVYHQLAGFIDFIVEPTMVVCGELLTKMVEPLVSLPPSGKIATQHF